MEIKLAETSGFCFGVINAVEKTKEALSEYENVYCLGELVNNEQVMAELKTQGLNIIESITETVSNSTVIIRAHGVVPEVYKEAQNKNINLIDLTCPKVKSIHSIVKEYSSLGYFIGITATKEHPEAIGTKGYAGKNSFIIECEEDVPAFLNFAKNQKVLLVSQTTFSLDKFNKICKACNSCNPEIKNTICASTKIRQEETQKIAESVDLMIVIGGKKSSNTKKLYEISQKSCKNAIMIETKEELNLNDIKQYDKIGIVAGASTPKEIIDEIIEFIQK